MGPTQHQQCFMRQTVYQQYMNTRAWVATGAFAHRAVPLTFWLTVCRLENGLNKLHKTQSEVDVLVENARAMALDVEQKVASANVFAEQVGVKRERRGYWFASAAWLKTTGLLSSS